MIENLPASAGDILGGGDPREEGMATHFSIIAWRIPWTEGVAESQTRLKRLSKHV